MYKPFNAALLLLEIYLIDILVHYAKIYKMFTLVYIIEKMLVI